MADEDDPYNPDKERPGYGISHPNYAAAHRHSYPGAPFDEPEIPDRKILQEIGKRLASAEGVDPTIFRVEMSCGEATIEGCARSEAEAARIEKLICETPGIAACRNNLRINSEQ